MAAAKCGTTSSASPLEFIQRDTAAVVQLSIRFTESCARRSRARVTRREPHEGAATRVPVLSMTHVFTRHRRQREGRGRGRRACHPVCMLQHVAIVESVPKRKSKFLSRLSCTAHSNSPLLASGDTWLTRHDRTTHRIFSQHKSLSQQGSGPYALFSLQPLHITCSHRCLIDGSGLGAARATSHL